MPRLSNYERHEALGMLRAMPAADVANHFQVHKSTIHRIAQRFNQTGAVADRERSGRPRATSAIEDRHIRTTHLRRRFKSAASTSRDWNGVNDISR